VSDAQAFCLNCEAVAAEGDFDCERDTDHDDFELCDKCASLGQRWSKPAPRIDVKFPRLDQHQRP
jgi:hypothetical protein